MNRHLIALLLAVAAVAAPLSAQSAAASRGTLYIVGGGPQPPALVQEFVDLAGGRGKARIVVFAMASDDGLEGGEEKAEQLRGLGAQARNVWITRAQAMTDSVARLLDGATGVWFGGGDQVQLADVLRGTPTERAIHARYAAGAVIGGTSAGAAVMSRIMITGDERTPGGDRPDTSLAWVSITRDNTLTTDGFALLDNAVIDQHFVRRKRHNRLISLVLERAPHLGAGIDESTALVVLPNGQWQVRGASTVIIYDARSATATAASQPLGAAGIKMHVLPAGSRFDPASGTATIAVPPR